MSLLGTGLFAPLYQRFVAGPKAPPKETIAPKPIVITPPRIHPADEDIGRTYCDPPGVCPHVAMEPAESAWAKWATRFTVTNASGEVRSRVCFHPHLALLRALHSPCDSVMDVGAGDGHAADLFRHIGKTVFSINADPHSRNCGEDFFGDYLDYRPPHSVDLIWCSHVLEHVRSPGAFLDKMFDELNDGGLLVVSVPYNEFNSSPDDFTMGHHNRYNVLLLAYQLVCAGFDCAAENFSMRLYNKQMSVIVRKARNGLPRSTMAPWEQLDRFFPVPLHSRGGSTKLSEINWPIP